MLCNCKGHLQANALAVYDAIPALGGIVEATCWAYARRYSFEAQAANRKLSDEVVALIRRLCAIEPRARGLSEPERKLLRLELAKPVLGELPSWMNAVEPTVLPQGPIGEPITYARKNWTAPNRYIDEGYLDIGSNAERALRRVVVGSKNWLFAGTAAAGRRVAIVMTLVNNGKFARVDPQAYLKDFLLATASVPMSQVERLTPGGWKADRDAAH